MIDTTDRAGDLETLRNLKEADDPRTIAEMKADDDNFEEGEVTSVERADATGFEVLYDGSTGLFVPRIEGKPEPKVGDVIRVYGAFGQPFYGIDLNGVEVFWRTPWERFANRIAMLAGFDRDNRETFAREREAMDRRYDELPPPLKARIDRFRAERADFRIDSEGYEMAAVGDAPKIARALARQEGWALDENLRACRGVVGGEPIPEPEVDRVAKAFFDADYTEQRQLVPDLDEGHSGNTFAGACSLAYRLLAGLPV